jgi:hypothetical protein
MDQGFTNVTVIDIAPLLVEKLQEKLRVTTGSRLFPVISLTIKANMI